MRRRTLMRRISDACSANGLRLVLVRQDGRHEVWDVGGLGFSVPRHRDINEWTAEAIMRDLEPNLGEGWWRR
jgi:hypothetical protein